jgi:Ca2+/H+ antiporter
MIIANGLVGASILIGALRHREQSFRIEARARGWPPSSPS